MTGLAGAGDGAWSMFLQAGPVVKAVMIGLALAVVLTWLTVFAKKLEIALASRRLRAASRGLAAQPDLTTALGLAAAPERVTRALLAVASDEIAQAGPDAAGNRVRDRIALRMGRVEAAAAREIGRGAGILATTGAIAPFVGLFGTVWGIMTSFVRIGASHSTNLATVAPGIAEALLATGIGLVAAIPAVVFYNHLGRAIGAYRALLGDAATLVLVLADRDLDRRGEG